MVDLIPIPQTREELRPPSPKDLIAQVQDLDQVHWEEIRPYIESVGGVGAIDYGHPTMAEAAAAMKRQEIASKNGYTLVASATIWQIVKAGRFAVKRNTGITFKALCNQNRMLQIEHQQAKAEAEAEVRPNGQANDHDDGGQEAY